MALSGHFILNGLLSNKTEDVLETIEILLKYNENNIPEQLISYLNISPSCIELLKVWSKYVIESMTVKKKNLESEYFKKNNEPIERIIVINVIECISTLIEYPIYITDMSLRNELKDNVDKLGMLIITKYMINIYRHLNSTSKNLISSALRLLSSISSLSKNHKEEILHIFNFNLPSFLTISSNFEFIKKTEYFLNNNYFEDLFTLLNNKRKEYSVRIQYLRFIMSFIDSDNKQDQKNMQEFLKIKNIGNNLFKNSINYDDQFIIEGILFTLENNIIDNRYIPNNNKRIFFNLTIINYIIGNLIDILNNIDLNIQLEFNNNENNNLKRYSFIIEKLIKYHINVRTKDKRRIILNWLKTIKQIKYPIIQDIIISIYNELNFKEKMDYYDNINKQINIINNKLENILLIGFLSKLLKNISIVEKQDLKEFIINNIFKKESIVEVEQNIQYLCNWIYPSCLIKLFNNIKILNTNENLFINISLIIILINITKRLFDIINMILDIKIQSKICNHEFIINMIRKNIYNSYPDFNNIINLLRNYFKDYSKDNDLIKKSFLKQEFLLNQSSYDKQKCELDNINEDDDIFINITNIDINKKLNNFNYNSKLDIKSNILLYHYIINNINSNIIKCIHCKEYFDINNNMVIMKYELIKLFFNIIKSILKAFGNEFLLTMGYKFDYTRLLLDEIYRECYINEDFLNHLTSNDYKILFDKLLYYIITYSLNINNSIYDVNCNKYLLFKFLDGLITVIYNYQIKFDNFNGMNKNNLRYVINYLTCMWIAIACKLNKCMNKIFNYFVSNGVLISSNKIKDKNNNFMDDFTVNSKYGDMKYFQYLDFKLILFIYKNIFNYSILIQCFFEDYIKENKIKRSFLENNIDLIILLLLINKKDDDDKYNLLINTMNFRNFTNVLKDEIEFINKSIDISDHMNNYIIKILKLRIEMEICVDDKTRSYIKFLLEIFNNWNEYENIRKNILKSSIFELELDIYNKVLLNINYYYKLLCEMDYDIKFDMNNIIKDYIIIISMNNINSKKSNMNTRNNIFKNILKMNNLQFGNMNKLSFINNLIIKENFDKVVNTLKHQFHIICNNNNSKKLIRSFIDVLMKLEIRNDLLFDILFNNILDNNINNLYKELINEIIYNNGFNEREEFTNIYLLDIILDNISNEEVILLCNYILTNNELSGVNKMFLSRLIEKVFELYLNSDNNKCDLELFGVYFVNFIDMIVNKNIFQYFDIKLYKLNYKENDNNGDKINLSIPLELFGNIENNNNTEIFILILVKFLTYLYLNYMNFYNELTKIIKQYSYKDIPIGIKLLLIYDHNLYLLYKNNNLLMDFNTEEEMIDILVDNLIFIYFNDYNNKNEIIGNMNERSMNKDIFKISNLMNLELENISEICFQNYWTQMKKDFNFWNIMNIFIFKYDDLKTKINFNKIINSNLIFKFVIKLFLRYNENNDDNNKLKICEITYLTYLFHYESIYLDNNDDNLIINTLISCYNKLLDKFQDLINNNNMEFELYYYYLILIPIITDKYINPIFYYLIIEIRNLYGNSSKISCYYNILMKLKKNDSFYELLNLIKLKEDHKLKYPIAFIEASKMFINYSKIKLDKEDFSMNNNIFLIILLFILYIAKIKQLKMNYINDIYNNLPNFVLLKINRINIFLMKIHELLFNHLNLECEIIDYENSSHIVILFIFVEYLLFLKEKENSNNFRYIKKEDIFNYMNITKICNFTNKNCLYNKLLEYSYNNYKGSIIDNKWMKIIITNYNIFQVNSRINNLINENIIDNEIDSYKLTKYWYHYYSISVLNFIDIDDIEFNWLTPNIKRLNKTLNDFPYDCKLIDNKLPKSDNIMNDDNFDTECEKEYIYSYDLGYIIPIINSRFKLAYSILRERGFHNSKNKIVLVENEQNNDHFEEIDDINIKKRKDDRKYSGFIENYLFLSNSKFFNLIDNNFIWLRNFCKNGSLKILINSLSCIDVSIRFYSYQCLSLLYEIVKFHYIKYIKKTQEIERQESIDDYEQTNSEDDLSKKINNKRKRNKRKNTKYVRHIFKELPQIYAILNTIKNTVSGAIYCDKNDENNNIHIDCIRLSSFVTRFLSDSIDIIFEPENKLYKQVNYFILSRSYIDRYDIPLLFTLLYSENTDDHSIYKSFIFRQLIYSAKILKLINNKGNALDQEHDALNRRFIFPLLLNYVKTNNIYSYHEFFVNTINILNFILNMINNNETNIIYYNENIENNFDDIFIYSPNLPIKINFDINDMKSSSSLLSSSIMLSIQLLNQYSLLDFIENLPRQLSNNKDDINNDYIKHIFYLTINILVNITRNIFIDIEYTQFDQENFFYRQLYTLKYHNNKVNKVILKFLGGYSNSYSIFQKLLNCIKILLDCIYNNDNDDQRIVDMLYKIWTNSYIGLLYVSKYIVKNNNVDYYSELIYNYQLLYHHFFQIKFG